MKSAPAITFDYSPSRWLVVALAGVALLAVLATAASAIETWMKLLLGVAVCIYAADAMRRLLHPVVRRCAWYEGGHWRVRDAAGQDHAASLLSASVRGNLIVLRLRSELQRSTALLLVSDNCDADTRRRLRVRLARADAIDAGA
jgi:toxin CptA